MRFPTSNDSMPNLLSSPRMANSQQPMLYNGMQQNSFPAQNQIRSNMNGVMQQEKTEIRNDFLLSDFDLDQKSMFHHAGDDSLHIDTQLIDFGLFSGRVSWEFWRQLLILVFFSLTWTTRRLSCWLKNCSVDCGTKPLWLAGPFNCSFIAFFSQIHFYCFSSFVSLTQV